MRFLHYSLYNFINQVTDVVSTAVHGYFPDNTNLMTF